MVKQYYSNELYHHGIKGQKWGVRRYQNADGTLTSAGKRRQAESSSESTKRKGLTDEQKATAKKVAIGAGVAAAAIGSAVYLSKHPEAIKALKSAGETAAIKAMYAGDKVKSATSGIAKKTAKSLGKATIEAGKSAYTAGLATVGTIAISKLATKTINTESKTETERNVKKIAYESGKAAISTATQGKSYNSGNNKGGNSGKNYSSAVGKPTNKGVDTSSAEYQQLMKTPYKDDIKTMRKQGYDIEQLKKYASMQHGGLVLENGIYFAVRDEEALYHHGVKGMKWGVRKQQPLVTGSAGRYDSAKQNYNSAKNSKKEAQREYHKAFNKYDRTSALALSPFSKHRAINDTRFDDMLKAAQKSKSADEAYKQAKKDFKQAKKDVKTEIKQTQKRYGDIEDKVTYGKHGNGKNTLTKVNQQYLKELDVMDKTLSELYKRK